MIRSLARLLPTRMKFALYDLIYDVVSTSQKYRQLKEKGSPTSEQRVSDYLPGVLLQLDQRITALEAKIASAENKNRNEVS